MTKKSILIPGHENSPIITFKQQHWSFIVAVYALVFLGAISPIIIIILINFFTPGLLSGALKVVTILLGTIYYLMLATFSLNQWIEHNYDILICTDRELIKVNQNGLVNRQIIEIPLVDIENVSAKMTGFLQSLFLYGDLKIEVKNSGKHTYEFNLIPDPINVADKILEVQNKEVNRLMEGARIEAPEKVFRSSKVVTQLETGTATHLKSMKNIHPEEKKKEGKVSKDDLEKGGEIKF